MNFKTHRFAGLFAIIAASVLACSVEAEDPCGDASAHLEECTGAAFDYGTCGEEEAAAAEQVLSASCETLSPPADAGKTDWWGSGNMLCGFLVGAKGASEGTLCCFDHNCKGELVCSDYACSDRAEAGESCERNGHCVSGLICDDSDQCSPPLQAGESCGGDAQCESDLTCMNGTCTPPSENGGACSDFGDCDSFLACIGGTCTERADIGETCDAGDSFDCDSGLYCIGGTCATEPALGDACESEPFYMCGNDRTCWNGVCEDVHGKGGACDSMFDCEFGLFCTGGVCAD